MNKRMLGVAAVMACLVIPLDGAVQAKRSSKTRTQASNGYTLAFVDADVRRVVDAILGSMLNLDYSVDPLVQGNVTLRTGQAVSRDALLPLLEGALRSVGAALVVNGNAYQIVPIAQARASAAPAPFGNGGSAGKSSPGFASEVMILGHGSAPEVARVLQQFLGKDIIARTDPTLNQITISGTGSEREAAHSLIARLDVDTLADMNFEVFRLQNVDANSLLGELERIFKPPYDIIGSRVRIIPLPRLRSVLAIAAQREDIARIAPWITRLDTGVAGKRKLYSYAVQNGRAKDLATALQQVLGMSEGGSSGSGAMAPQSSNRSSAGVSPGGSEGEIAAVAPSADLPSSSTNTGASAGVRIVPNEPTNALLIYADGEEYEFIREAVDKLDQPVAQVLIEAILAEVTLNKDMRYGVSFRGLDGNKTFTNSTTSSSLPASIFPGFSVSLIGGDVSGVLNTLQSKTNVRVLSAPKLIVLNNQTATLQVGDQVPIVSQQAQSVASPGAPIVNTIELRDTGVILKVTPRVNDSGTVTLDIDQEVSDVAETTTSGINSPTIQQRRLSSTVATRSGQMIALGGLIRDRDTKTKSGIPLLSQIPIVGGAFGKHVIGGSRTELIILLTPTVIRSPQDVGPIVDELINGLDLARPLVERAKARQVGHPERLQ